MSQAFTTQIEAGIAELVLAKPPVNAWAARSGWTWPIRSKPWAPTPTSG